MKKTAIYLNNPISFLAEDGQAMVSATEMAKAFSKRPSEFIRLPSTIAFRAALVAMGKSLSVDGQILTNAGGAGGGGVSWFTEDLAIEFARWLSPEFAIWTNDRIKEFAKFGFTAKQETLEAMIANPDLVIGLATQLKESRQKLYEANDTIALQAPAVEFQADVFEAKDLLTMAQVAKMLGLGRNDLFAKLRMRRVLMMGTRQNEPYQTFIERGYFVLKGAKVGSAKFPKVVSQTMVTTRGLAWIRLNIV